MFLKAAELVSLRAEVEEKDSRIADLETLCNERPDQSRLLAAMESDKVAAAQATSQNAVLKQQLLELQHGFIKMVVILSVALWSHKQKKFDLEL